MNALAIADKAVTMTSREIAELKFAALCVFGEWFKDDGSIAEFIEKHQLRAEAAL